MSWTKITSKSGDSGTSQIRGCVTLPKTDPVFSTLHAVERAHAKIASVACLSGQLDSKMDEHAGIMHFGQFLERIDLDFREILSELAVPVGGMYLEIDSTFLDTLVQDLGHQLDSLGVKPGWTSYAKVRIQLVAQIYGLCVAVRGAELALYLLKDRGKIHATQKAYLNRLSKVLHMWAVYAETVL